MSLIPQMIQSLDISHRILYLISELLGEIQQLFSSAQHQRKTATAVKQTVLVTENVKTGQVCWFWLGYG